MNRCLVLVIEVANDVFSFGANKGVDSIVPVDLIGLPIASKVMKHSNKAAAILRAWFRILLVVNDDLVWPNFGQHSIFWAEFI